MEAGADQESCTVPSPPVAVSDCGADEVTRNWDEIKKEEKKHKAERAGLDAVPEAPSALDGVPFGQPALSLAAQLQRRAARAGVPDALTDLPGEEIGAELFRLVAKARAAGLEPETELRAAARRYRDREWGVRRPHRTFRYSKRRDGNRDPP